MKADFLPPLANARDFPPARIGMLPGLRTAVGSSTRARPENCQAIASMASARGLLSAVAYHFSGRNVLLPAYHCPAMVEPFLYHQCNIAFYRVTEQLGFDAAELETKLPAADVVVGVRFFGFDCQMPLLKQLADKTNTLMVEDLAHAAFVRRLYGDFAVTSLKKFYPVRGGAELYVANSQWVAQLERSVRSLRRSFLQTLAEKLLLKLRGKPKTGFRYFSPLASHEPMAASDRRLLSHYDHRQSVLRRRENYERLLEGLGGLGFAEPLFPELACDVVPYVFPMRLKDERFFSLVRQQGIPLYRWEEIIPSHCPVSMELRRLLIQLPCHQDLTGEDVDFLINTLTEIDRQQGCQISD